MEPLLLATQLSRVSPDYKSWLHVPLLFLGFEPKIFTKEIMFVAMISDQCNSLGSNVPAGGTKDSIHLELNSKG